MNEVIVGIDIGSSKVCTIVGEINKKSQLQIMGVGTAECKGLKKGIIVDIDDAVEAIKKSIDQSERMSGLEITSGFINIPGGHVTLIKNRGVIAVSGEDREITQEDVKRVLEVVKITNIPIDREVIGVIPSQFIVDGYGQIKDPVGMIGVRLEVEAYIITAATATVQSLVRIVERCGIGVLGIVIDPIAASEVVLSREEKESGVALVDIGGEITDIAIFINNKLVFTKLIPIGGNFITNDISIGLKIPVSEAETLKRQYGYAAVSMVKPAEDITINTGGPGLSRTISSSELIDIIEARVQEIYYLINKELEASGFKDSIAGGIVITGGGLSFIKGTLEVAAAVTGVPVRTGSPSYIGVASPVYTTATGIVKYILSSRRTGVTNMYPESEDSRAGMARLKKNTNNKNENIVDRIKDFFTDFF